MPRGHGPGRGTRRYKGVQSGVTWATFVSGVTIDKQGMDSGGGTQLKFNAGNTAWAGASLTISHGFGTLTGFSGTLAVTGATQPAVVIMQDNGISGGVSVAAMEPTNNGLMKSGGTVFWTAWGTD